MKHKSGASVQLLRTATILMMIPIFGISIGIVLFGEFHAQYIEYKYGIHSENFKYFPDTIQVYDLATDVITDELLEVIECNPDKIRNAVYLEEVNNRLEEHQSYLIIKSGDVVTYVGDAQKYNALDKELLSVKIDCEQSDEYGMYVSDDRPMLIKNLDFEFPSGEPGDAFVIIDVSQSIPEAEDYVTSIVFIITLMIIFVGAIVILILWRRVLCPLNKLEMALQMLAQGNYENEIESQGTVEVYKFAERLNEVRLQLKNREDEYLNQEKEAKEMISNISHDLKTPVTSIKGYAEGLVDGIAATKERREKYTRTILAKANQLDHLIGELSLYSQVNRKHMMYKFQELNIKSYFDDCAEDLAIDLENRGIEFIYQNYVEDHICINADSQHLERVIQNIVNNSIKYIYHGRPIVSLRVTDEDDAIVLRIVDNGQGISEEDLQHVFDRFYRSDQSRNSDTGGSGIGLAIVKEIVEAHDGKVWATSKPDVGTVMHIKLNKIVGE